MDISDDDGDKEADYNYEDVPDDRDWIEEEGASKVKKLKLPEAHPGANFRVLRTVLYAHGRLDFNRHLALWDLPSLYQVAAHDKVLADALMGNEAARVRYQARQASLDARVMAWAAIEVNVVMWFDSRLSDKGRAEGINYRHVAVCAYVAATPGEWGVKWPGMHGYMIRGSTHTGNVTVDTQSKDEAYIAALPVIRFLLSRALDLYPDRLHHGHLPDENCRMDFCHITEPKRLGHSVLSSVPSRSRVVECGRGNCKGLGVQLG